MDPGLICKKYPVIYNLKDKISFKQLRNDDREILNFFSLNPSIINRSNKVR